MKKIISIFLVFLMLITIMSPLVLARENSRETSTNTADTTSTTQTDTTASTTSTDDDSEETTITYPTESVSKELDEYQLILQESEWYKKRLQEMEQERLQEMTGEEFEDENEDEKEYHDDIFKNENYKNGQDKKITIDLESLDDDIEESKGKEDKNQIRKQVYVRASQDFDITTIKGAEIIATLDNGYIISVPVTQINELVQDDEVLKVVDENSIKSEEEKEQKRIINDYQERKIERKQLEVKPEEIEQAKEDSIKSLKDLGYTDEEIKSTSPYLYYFLNSNLMPTTTTIQEAYDSSASIVYISDDLLWETTEKWVSPNTVFDETPTLETNPIQKPVSDCEEHAITFVAMARQQNIPPENVRVVLGYVEIDNQKFGHAWAQIKLADGTWMNVEPTSGSYIENNELVKHDSLGLYYYKDKTYPVVEIWGYFNDKYYIDSSGIVAPQDWVIQDTSYNVGNQMNPSVNGYIDGVLEWIQKEFYTLIN